MIELPIWSFIGFLTIALLTGLSVGWSVFIDDDE